MAFDLLLHWRERGWRSPRRDGAALGFGSAFLAFGGAGLLRALGVRFESVWFYPLAFVLLGVAGLVSLLLQRRKE